MDWEPVERKNPHVKEDWESWPIEDEPHGLSELEIFTYFSTLPLNLAQANEIAIKLTRTNPRDDVVHVMCEDHFDQIYKDARAIDDIFPLPFRYEIHPRKVLEESIAIFDVKFGYYMQKANELMDRQAFKRGTRNVAHYRLAAFKFVATWFADESDRIEAYLESHPV